MTYLEKIKKAKKEGATWLDLSGTDIDDLTLLKGMQLKRLFLDGKEVSDLSPLKGMLLEELDISHTEVLDLSPLKGMPLKRLFITNTPAAEKPFPKWLRCKIYK